MKKTKLIALLLVLTFAAGLFSCTRDVRGTVESDTSAGTDEGEDSFELGSSAGNVYTNRFLGIGCKLDESWSFYTDEQIAELNGRVGEMMNEDYSKIWEKADIIYDMYVADGHGDSININITNMGIANGLIYSEDNYAKQSLEQMPKAFESSGLEITGSEVTTATLAGAQHAAIDLTLDYGGVTIYERIVCIKKGVYMACVTFTVLDKADLATLFESFYAVGK